MDVEVVELLAAARPSRRRRGRRPRTGRRRPTASPRRCSAGSRPSTRPRARGTAARGRRGPRTPRRRAGGGSRGGTRVATPPTCGRPWIGREGAAAEVDDVDLYLAGGVGEGQAADDGPQGEALARSAGRRRRCRSRRPRRSRAGGCPGAARTAGRRPRSGPAAGGPSPDATRPRPWTGSSGGSSRSREGDSASGGSHTSWAGAAVAVQPGDDEVEERGVSSPRAAGAAVGGARTRGRAGSAGLGLEVDPRGDERDRPAHTRPGRAPERSGWGRGRGPRRRPP